MRIAVALAAVLLALPAAAQEPPGVAFRPVVQAAVEQVIVPAHEAFVAAAGDEVAALTALCDAPSPAALDAAKAGFAALVRAYGRIEPFRIGPAVADNRFDRLLFWPDRRSRGQRQVEQLIAAGGEADVAALRAKSVAVQGLPALELVLYGTGADTLATPEGAARCGYAQAIAGAVRETGEGVLAGWTGPFGAAVMAAGDDPASPYRSHGEVVKDMLQSAAELLQTDATLKLGPNVIGASAGEGNPKLAPFWRSGATATLLIGNAETLSAFVTPALERALGAAANEASQTRFELRRAVAALTPAAGTPLPDVVATPDGYGRLKYAASVLGAAQRLYAQKMPAAFGFAAGFNALDGD